MRDTRQETESLPNTRRKVFFGLFVFPLLIAVTMAVLLCGIVLLTHEEETPETLITAIKTGSPSRRWQKAFELSNELNRDGGMIRSQGIMNDVIHILNDKEHYDAKTRAYMAMALARFESKAAGQALQEALRAAGAEEDPETALFVMWALGTLQYRPAVSEAAGFLTSEHAELRKTAAYVLGVLGDPVARDPLKAALADPVADVGWNAALSLARLGDDAGWETLIRMLDRKRLAAVHRLDEEKIEKAMVNAAKGLALIGRPEAAAVLERVSENDQNLKVRQAALTALQFQKQ